MSLLSKVWSLGRNEQYDRALRLFDQGRYEDAIIAFEQVNPATQNRRDAFTERLSLFYIAESYAQVGQSAITGQQWARAEDCYRRALAIHPHYADLNFNLAVALRAQGKPQEAIDTLVTAIAINPHYAKAFLFQGVTLYEIG
ncbi:MAG: tetratricopeptide repeat protein [Armatimonadetes bacterium]|nr:tetratricopeptide repeat protein [Armatimonadota bacterium]